MKKIIVCWIRDGHDIIDSEDDLPENAGVLAAWAEYTPGEPCPLCGASPEEIEGGMRDAE